MLDNTECKEYIDKLYENLHHQVFTTNANIAQFKYELTELWFNQQAFVHVVCGQPEKLKLGWCKLFSCYVQAQGNHCAW
ncbi:hypothetical protein ECHHL_0818 [Ehrlichia chaffeensis str. Heartland]|uniref:hypothetical protein n=1 Tax=Ehrlichia chaffeensis TaxID=945 RepID=UPI0002EF52D9|nr:hypothetical protein [Ehrlichia chaffeensis]AHX03954.1 hypothetical protein ECHHL_0818 [Ehrlichia chaffeensis str. Heartland]AHX10752.1 hypothetical protein ECHWP_0814 [Ehrlichia chaffeensis str. West Paces]